MEKPIYREICEHIKDGVLDADFKVELDYVPGAVDGWMMYHKESADGLSASQIRNMVEAIEIAANGDFSQADELFYELTKENRAISLMSELHKYAIKHAGEIDSSSLFYTAMDMVMRSAHIECVKIGMELMEMFQPLDDGNYEIIRQLGLCDEFTIFAVRNMLKRENGNSEIFELAKKVHGWGRIHAVKYLEPETEEIRRWLLTEGADNNIDNAYSALVCWEKSDAEKILSGQPTEEEFKGIINMIDGLIEEQRSINPMTGLLDKTPVPGITKLEDAEKVILRFLEIAPKYNLTVRDYETIYYVWTWAYCEDVPVSSVLSACDEILHSGACIDTVKEAVKNHEALHLAMMIDIPFRDGLLEGLKNDFENNYRDCHYLMKDSRYVEPTLEIFRENIPLSKEQRHSIIPYLAPYPLVGKEFVMMGLAAGPVESRRFTLDTLSRWVRKTKMPLAELSPLLYTLVEQLGELEEDETNLKMIESLLKGNMNGGTI